MSKLSALAGILCLSLTASLKADGTFIDGFPDIPRLDIVSGIESDPLVFDTPSGTVAEVGLRFSVPAPAALNSYSEALVGLGWGCTLSQALLRCNRDESSLQLIPPATSGANQTFMLRLEPRG